MLVLLSHLASGSFVECQVRSALVLDIRLSELGMYVKRRYDAHKAMELRLAIGAYCQQAMIIGGRPLRARWPRIHEFCPPLVLDTLKT
ncbi:uncharacterized protein LACBIDRAFT_296103 [Laccaria bicolor S238N-H82]|uniref:Predicted protein n=1 Tax=Laccaria bicolor (strain S238N-H82 / ATCC MYA-4686) TaxID=486041 RepID=B0E2U7_LACBS|nr:uncharacterized protein LACBIDRAFT_296103 [Laccaria bicolor S238N-H82]EDQ98829.1 predicted protein [Laccaria bicolor S238N-H82]|eukprot:XP_001890515.1 predicted protein [Laccaria bicolor S238N-H82]